MSRLCRVINRASPLLLMLAVCVLAASPTISGDSGSAAAEAPPQVTVVSTGPPPALVMTATPTATATAQPTATPRPLVWRILRAQLVRAKPDGHSRTGPLVRFGQVVVLKGRPVHGWQYIVAGQVRGWVLARNLYRS